MMSTVAVQQLQAQTDEEFEGGVEEIEELFPSDAFNLGALLQAQAEVHWDPSAPGQNTFRVPSARMRAWGTLSDNFSYYLRTEFVQSPAILDAYISYQKNNLTLAAGAMKPRLSQEFILNTTATDFINRSRIVQTLAERWDIGVSARYQLSPDVSLYGGMFNGTNQQITNNDNSFYYVGRLNFERQLNESTLFRAAFNASHSSESGTDIGSGLLPAVNGNRTIIGGDIRLEVQEFLLSSELLYGDLEYGPVVDDEVTGFHITGGYSVQPNTTLLLRLDHLESEVVPIPVEDQLLAAVSHNFSSATNFQFNYLLNPDDFDAANQYWLNFSCVSKQKNNLLSSH